MPQTLDQATANRVQERAAALESIDKRLSSILEMGAASIDVIQRSSHEGTGDQEAVKQEFKEVMQQYQELVLSVNSDLRKEVELLYEAWHKDVLPLNLQAKANTFGRLKQDEIWAKIRAQIDEK